MTKIHIKHPHERAVDAIASGATDGEWQVLTALASLVLGGRPIPPEFQELANAVVVRAVAFGTLPPMRQGRPKQDGLPGFEVAVGYFQLRDRGVPYQAAVEAMAEKFHKDERQVMRYVERWRTIIGETSEDREWKRTVWKVRAESSSAPSDRPREPTALEILQRSIEEQDDSKTLDNLLESAVNRAVAATDKK